MQIQNTPRYFSNQRYTDVYVRRMLSPLCGMVTNLQSFLRGRGDARLAVVGAQITGVHEILGRPPPEHSYHIGGGGIFPEEALIRALGESIERYSQLMGGLLYRSRLRFQSYEDLVASGERVIDEKYLQFFSADQFQNKGFLFDPFDRKAPIAWIKSRTLTGDDEIWAPAQILTLGYNVHRDAGEPWLISAVTTGSAAHTDPMKALRNCILEMIQLDTSMGHWYTDRPAWRIALDDRVAVISALIRKVFPKRSKVEFYRLTNADLPGHHIACQASDPGELPAVALGMGTDTNLTEAMYKAMLEAVGVVKLARLLAIQMKINGNDIADLDPETLFDLDNNVLYYALPENSGLLQARFGDEPVVKASAIEPDWNLDAAGDVGRLVDAFRATGKELLFMDLTSDDMKALGFYAMRAWSPQTLSLTLPSAPALAHPRYRDYGGTTHAAPHPYP